MFDRLRKRPDYYPTDGEEFVPTTAFDPPVEAVSDICFRCDNVPMAVRRVGKIHIALCGEHLGPWFDNWHLHQRWREDDGHGRRNPQG